MFGRMSTHQVETLSNIAVSFGFVVKFIHRCAYCSCQVMTVLSFGKVVGDTLLILGCKTILWAGVQPTLDPYAEAFYS